MKTLIAASLALLLVGCSSMRGDMASSGSSTSATTSSASGTAQQDRIFNSWVD